MRHPNLLISALFVFHLSTPMAGSNSETPKQVDKQAPSQTQSTLYNPGAYIPLQCYTKTRQNNRVHNPCFSCHTEGVIPNYLDGRDLQKGYEFPALMRKNPWTNAFKDWSKQVSAISDQEIMRYVRDSNYFDQDHRIKLRETLQTNLPKTWDLNQNGRWDGYLPDAYFNFDNHGFDRKQNGEFSGWRAFAYAPFLGTFWPTNGSINDVMIRLGEDFRSDHNQQPNLDIYKLNLAIVEAVVRQKNITIPAIEESTYGIDLNQNGTLDLANTIVFSQTGMSYIGAAQNYQISPGLYPVSTEFLHSVRYLDFNEHRRITLAPRLKELRYAKKTHWLSVQTLKHQVEQEMLEEMQQPDALREIQGNAEIGLSNDQGWWYQGFIEDSSGALRPQTYEESMTCVGCHSGIAATTDSSFAFARRLGFEHAQQGWSHWSQYSMYGQAEPRWQDGTFEYTHYLQQNHSGNEFRNNSEVQSRFFDNKGRIRPPQIETLHHDISHLIMPSVVSAIAHNKAYKAIVDEQSFIYGRDAHIQPMKNVWEIVPENEKTGVQSVIVTQPLQ